MLDAFLNVLQGLPMTLLLTVASFVIGGIVGIPLALGLRSKIAPLRWLLRFLVDLIRGIPIIVWIFVLYYGISQAMEGSGYEIENWVSAIISLSIVSAAYLAEIYRGGILAVPTGQTEAAHALGIKGRPAFLRIVAPQAFKISLPSIATYAIGLFKDTSIASAIITPDIVYYAQSYARQNPDAGIWPYAFAAAIYVVVSVPVAMWSRRVDRRLQEAGH
jgi:polar amino acid transport system permease protein/cystine transport system permease protein